MKNPLIEFAHTGLLRAYPAIDRREAVTRWGSVGRADAAYPASPHRAENLAKIKDYRKELLIKRKVNAISRKEFHDAVDASIERERIAKSTPAAARWSRGSKIGAGIGAAAIAGGAIYAALRKPKERQLSSAPPLIQFGLIGKYPKSILAAGIAGGAVLGASGAKAVGEMRKHSWNEHRPDPGARSPEEIAASFRKLNSTAYLSGSSALGIGVPGSSDVDVHIPTRSVASFKRIEKRLMKTLEPSAYYKPGYDHAGFTGKIDGRPVDVAVTYGEKGFKKRDAIRRVASELTNEERQQIIATKQKLKQAWVAPTARYHAYKRGLDIKHGIPLWRAEKLPEETQFSARAIREIASGRLPIASAERLKGVWNGERLIKHIGSGGTQNADLVLHPSHGVSIRKSYKDGVVNGEALSSNAKVMMKMQGEIGSPSGFAKVLAVKPGGISYHEYVPGADMRKGKVKTYNALDRIYQAGSGGTGKRAERAERAMGLIKKIFKADRPLSAEQSRLVEKIKAQGGEIGDIRRANIVKGKVVDYEATHPSFADEHPRFTSPQGNEGYRVFRNRKLSSILPLIQFDDDLQPHQRRVIRRIQDAAQSGLVVAHGPGSGKTRSAIEAHKALGGEADVVLPAALKANYAKEQAKWDGPESNIISQQALSLKGSAALQKPLLIVDEAHRARNPRSKLSEALRGGSAQKRLLLTGTPSYNNPADLASLVNTAAGKQELPEGAAFKNRYLNPGFFDRLRGRHISNSGELKKKLNKYVDYHKGGGDGSNMPSVKSRTIPVEMGKHQSALYRASQGKIPSGMKMHAENIERLAPYLTGARQVSNTSRALDPRSNEEPKLDKAFSDLQEHLKNPKGKALVYSNWLDHGIKPMQQRLTASKTPFGTFTGDESPKVRDQFVRDYNSNKLRALLVSSSGAEGLDLKGTRMVQVLEPHFNNSKIRQVVGRSARMNSHAHLAPEDRNVEVRQYVGRPRNRFLPGSSKGVEDMLAESSRKKDEVDRQIAALLHSKMKPIQFALPGVMSGKILHGTHWKDDPLGISQQIHEAATAQATPMDSDGKVRTYKRSGEKWIKDGKKSRRIKASDLRDEAGYRAARHYEDVVTGDKSLVQRIMGDKEGIEKTKGEILGKFQDGNKAAVAPEINRVRSAIVGDVRIQRKITTSLNRQLGGTVTPRMSDKLMESIKARGPQGRIFKKEDRDQSPGAKKAAREAEANRQSTLRRARGNLDTMVAPEVEASKARAQKVYDSLHAKIKGGVASKMAATGGAAYRDQIDNMGHELLAPLRARVDSSLPGVANKPAAVRYKDIAEALGQKPEHIESLHRNLDRMRSPKVGHIQDRLIHSGRVFQDVPGAVKPQDVLRTDLKKFPRLKLIGAGVAAVGAGLLARKLMKKSETQEMMSRLTAIKFGLTTYAESLLAKAGHVFPEAVKAVKKKSRFPNITKRKKEAAAKFGRRQREEILREAIGKGEVVEGSHAASLRETISGLEGRINASSAVSRKSAEAERAARALGEHQERVVEKKAGHEASRRIAIANDELQETRSMYEGWKASEREASKFTLKNREDHLTGLHQSLTDIAAKKGRKRLLVATGSAAGASGIGGYIMGRPDEETQFSEKERTWKQNAAIGVGGATALAGMSLMPAMLSISKIPGRGLANKAIARVSKMKGLGRVFRAPKEDLNAGGKMVADYLDAAQSALNTGLHGKLAGAVLRRAVEKPKGFLGRLIGDKGDGFHASHYARFRAGRKEALGHWDQEHAWTMDKKGLTRGEKWLKPRQEKMRANRESAHAEINDQLWNHGKNESEAIRHVATTTKNPQTQDYFNELAKHKAGAAQTYAGRALGVPIVTAGGAALAGAGALTPREKRKTFSAKGDTLHFGVSQKDQQPKASVASHAVTGGLEGALGIYGVEPLLEKLKHGGKISKRFMDTLRDTPTGHLKKIGIGALVGAAATAPVGWAVEKYRAKQGRALQFSSWIDDPNGLTGRVAADRFRKKIKEEDLDRRDANIVRTAILGGAAGLASTSKLSRRMRAAIGASAGAASVLGIRAVTAGGKDRYGDRTHEAKYIEGVPWKAAGLIAGGLGARRIYKKLRLASAAPTIQFDADDQRLADKLIIKQYGPKVSRPRDWTSKWLRDDVNVARRTADLRQGYSRTSGLLGDVKGALTGEKAVDARGRPRKREWEKPWAKKVAITAIVGGVGFGGLRIVRKMAQNPGALHEINKLWHSGAVGRVVRSKIPGAQKLHDFFQSTKVGLKDEAASAIRQTTGNNSALGRLAGYIDREDRAITGVAAPLVTSKASVAAEHAVNTKAMTAQSDAAAKARLDARLSPEQKAKAEADKKSLIEIERDRKRRGQIETSSMAKLIEFDDYYAPGRFDLRDQRGNSARIHVDGKAPRIRRPQYEWEKKENEGIKRALILSGGLLLGGTIGAFGRNPFTKKADVVLEKSVAKHWVPKKQGPGDAGVMSAWAATDPLIALAAKLEALLNC